jgi:hypothetical protein
MLMKRDLNARPQATPEIATRLRWQERVSARRRQDNDLGS